MIIVTTATGEAHRAYAARLAASFREHKWPPLIVLADAPVDGCEAVIIEDKSRGGRELKIRFARHIPDTDENIYFIDADCEAVGKFPGAPEVKSGQIAGIILKTYRTSPPSHMLCSALNGFHNHAEALAFGEEWWRQYQLMASDQRGILKDEMSQFRATKKREIIPCGSFTFPLVNLRHHLATSKQGGNKKRDLRGWFNFADIYDEVVEKAPIGATLIEVGVWQGQSLDYLSKNADAAEKDLLVIGYDQFDPAYYLGPPTPGLTSEEWLSQVRDRCDTAQVLISDSSQAAKNHADGSVFFVFLDAGHTEDQLSADIRAWAPKIQPGGILAGHDLDHPRHPGVRAALENSGLQWVPKSKSSWVSAAPEFRVKPDDHRP